ncbi:MAG: hypothetical protein RL733_106 [Actinomycetota bacterium]
MLEIASRILCFVGTPKELADSVAESLVLAQQSGHTSHGVMRLIEYVEFVRKGEVSPAAVPQIVSERGAVITLNGNWGWGQIACKKAVELAVEKAKNFGISSIAINSCNHIGRLGEYVEMLSKQSLVAIMFCNTGASVAPYGGKTRLFGTNPFAAAIPGSDGDIVIDFATAASAEGKLRIAHLNGQKIPEGLVISKEGQSTTNPADFYEGGALLPFGGHKGYCLNLLIELLGGSLSGIHPAMNEAYDHGNGTVLIAMDPDFFVGVNNFDQDISEAKHHIKTAPAVNDSTPILLPGEMETNAIAKNSIEIEVPSIIWQSILELEKSVSKLI